MLLEFLDEAVARNKFHRVGLSTDVLGQLDLNVTVKGFGLDRGSWGGRFGGIRPETKFIFVIL